MIKSCTVLCNCGINHKHALSPRQQSLIKQAEKEYAASGESDIYNESSSTDAEGFLMALNMQMLEKKYYDPHMQLEAYLACACPVEDISQLSTYEEDGGDKVSRFTKKETIMNPVKATNFAGIINDNKNAAVDGAKMALATVAVGKVKAFVSPKVPVFLRGYFDGPFGDVICANLLKVIVANYIPGNAMLAEAAEAGLTGSYFKLVESVDIGSLIGDLTGLAGGHNPAPVAKKAKSE